MIRKGNLLPLLGIYLGNAQRTCAWFDLLKPTGMLGTWGAAKLFGRTIPTQLTDPEFIRNSAFVSFCFTFIVVIT